MVSNTVPPPQRTLPIRLADPIDPLVLEAMREVDALTPACPPIAPPLTLQEMLARGLIKLPDAHAIDCACPDHRRRPRSR